MVRSSLSIHVYGDSLSLPRAVERMHAADTYPELVRRALEAARPDSRVELHNRSRGGAPIGDLYRLFSEDEAYFEAGPDALLVIQCGVVDCAPRPVSPRLRAGIGRLPVPLRWLVVKCLHFLRPFLLTAGLRWSATEPEPFEATLTRWLLRANKRFGTIYVINIAPTVPAIEAHSPGLAQSIVSYNASIARCIAAIPPRTVRLIDVHQAISQEPGGIERYINPRDGHHITADGHRFYAKLIVKAATGRLDI